MKFEIEEVLICDGIGQYVTRYRWVLIGKNGTAIAQQVKAVATERLAQQAADRFIAMAGQFEPVEQWGAWG